MRCAKTTARDAATAAAAAAIDAARAATAAAALRGETEKQIGRIVRALRKPRRGRGTKTSSSHLIRALSSTRAPSPRNSTLQSHSAQAAKKRAADEDADAAAAPPSLSEAQRPRVCMTKRSGSRRRSGHEKNKATVRFELPNAPGMTPTRRRSKPKSKAPLRQRAVNLEKSAQEPQQTKPRVYAVKRAEEWVAGGAEAEESAASPSSMLKAAQQSHRGERGGGRKISRRVLSDTERSRSSRRTSRLIAGRRGAARGRGGGGTYEEGRTRGRQAEKSARRGAVATAALLLERETADTLRSVSELIASSRRERGGSSSSLR